MRRALLTIALVTLAAQSAQGSACSDHLLALKANLRTPGETTSDYDATLCSAVFSHFGKHVHHVHDLINEHLRQSLLYSVMSSHFNSDFPNRLGFGKYMDGLADQMWEDAIELIKYVGLRGSSMAPQSDPSVATGLRVSNLDTGIGAWSEIEALGLALDRHQRLALDVHRLHSTTKDAAMLSFLENQFTSKHASRIRELSGHLTNLVPMWEDPISRDMALYFFDQSLA